MRNKYEIFALVIISVFVIGVLLIKPEYTGFTVFEGGEKIYVSEAIYDEENVTEDLRTLDEIYVKVKENESFGVIFSDFLEDGYELNMYLNFEKDNSSMVIYDENHTAVGFIYPNETVVEEVKWYNVTLNLSSLQNKFFIEVTEKVNFDYIEATVIIEETTTTTTIPENTTTTTTIPTNTTTTTILENTTTTTTTVEPASGYSSDSGSKTFDYREEEKAEESGEEIETENIVATEVELSLPTTVSEENIEESTIEQEIEKSGLLKTVGSTIVENIQRPSFIKFLGLIICVGLLFLIYYKNRTKH